MAALAPGILQKLIDGMKTGIKPTREHRSSMLQVTDIVPIGLDEKSLEPKQGFLIKVSDSSNSIYVSLPSDQDDVVLSNKLQLGQFIYVDRLEPGSPVPVIKGAKPIPGRHPLLGSPEPLMMGLKGKAEQETVSKPRRGSWGQNVDVSSPFVVKPMSLDFEHSTPAKRSVSARFAASPIRRGRGVRCSFGGGVLGRMEGGESPATAMLRKSCAVPSASKFPRSKSVCDRETKKNNTSASLLSPFKFSLEAQEDVVVPLATSKRSTSLRQEMIKLEKDNNLLGRLNTLSKEATQLRETAQKIALQALREATATETVVRHIKTFANLSKSAKAECPTACFEKFMQFHQEMAQTVTEITSIEAAALDAENKSQKPREEESSSSSILHEIAYNSIDQEKRRSKRRIILKQQSEGSLRSNDENKNPACGGIGNTIRLAKEIEDEAANWFMDFIETALEKGMKKSKGPDDADVKKVPQSLILSVLNWIEVAQSDSNKNKRRAGHPKASKITRKLRIKLKNP
ncbi:PREDICTED: uncharacterized protein LOC104712579 [Camelina sativa]|uniref:Uncharacterized protein LOC104712579 n=1 Tax=Camelina sativa TaxID=90675 RepID=A0ABM0TKN5_CAMSA|nr:PREDICTED: uncharacterized protein LOC104712579 [Camelina sativa]